MLALDTCAAIAAFQTQPKPDILVYRERVRRFILDCGNEYFFPSVALSEYMFKFDEARRAVEFAELTKKKLIVLPFDEATAVIAAEVGRTFASGRKLSDVAREYDTDRVSLKADLLIVATALQHSATDIVTHDKLPFDLATFVNIKAHRLADLPDVPPPPPPSPRAATGNPRQATIFNLLPPAPLDDDAANGPPKSPG